MTTTAYLYDAATLQYTGAVACPDGTCPLNATLTPLPAGSLPTDIFIWQGQWVKKTDGVSLITGFLSSQYQPMTKFAFLNRLLQSERIAILSLGQTDMYAADFINMLNSAPAVLLNDPRVVSGLNYCASKIPAITPARVTAILDPTR